MMVMLYNWESDSRCGTDLTPQHTLYKPPTYGTLYNLTRTSNEQDCQGMTTRECVQLVTGSYFRSRNKDGGHAISIGHSRKSMPHAHFTALCVIKMPSYWRWNFHAAGMQTCPDTQVSVASVLDGCGLFLLLWPWPWPNDLHIRTWSVLRRETPDVQIWILYVKAFESYRLTDRQTYKQTESTKIINHATSWVVKYYILIYIYHSKWIMLSNRSMWQ